MNKSLFKKIFIPVVIIGTVILLITMLLINSETMVNDLLISLIIWIPLCAIVCLGVTILDEKKKLNLENKISNLTAKLKSKPKSKPKIVKKESVVKSEAVVAPETVPEVKKEKDPFEVTIEEVEKGVYNLDFGDIIPPVKLDKAISSVVVFSNESVKSDFKAFCDNGFKPVDKKSVVEKPKTETEFVVVKKPAVIKKPKNAPASIDNNIQLDVVSQPPVTPKPEVKLTPEVPVKPVETKKELPELVFIPEEASNSETVISEVNVPEENVKPVVELKTEESVKSEVIEVQKPENIDTPVPQPEVVKQEKVEIPVPQPKVVKEEVKPKTVKSPFKIPAFKFNPKNKTIQQNEEAIFNPVAMKPKDLDIPEKPPKLIITDERLVKIVKHPEIMTPAEVKLVNSNMELKKRYYEFMSALFEEEDD